MLQSCSVASAFYPGAPVREGYIASALSTTIPKPRVFFTVFAGRQENLVILNKYVQHLMAKGLVDEYHLWDFTRKASDAAWIRNWKADARDPRIRVLQPKDKNNWGTYYQHYAQIKNAHADDIVIKCDDDVWFLDTHSFADFIARRRLNRDPIAVFPNIINNGVCAHHQQKAGLWPRHKFGDLPYDTFMGRVVRSGRLAHDMHTHFLNNSAAFLTMCKQLPIIKIPKGDRISINCFAVLGTDWHRLVIGPHDEHELSVDLPNKYGREHAIDQAFVVAHGAFANQRDSGLDEAALRKRYLDLATELFRQ